VGGSGDISKVDVNTTLINQSSQHMAINWDSYNVAANETVRYVQPSASAISLNRILGVNGSTIAGQIQSNGQVILINPNGLVFTDTSVLNVGGIIASNEDYFSEVA
jgi:filamentous hemagglutinin family protein